MDQELIDELVALSKFATAAHLEIQDRLKELRKRCNLNDEDWEERLRQLSKNGHLAAQSSS